MKRSTAYILVAAVLVLVAAYLAVSLTMVGKQREELQCTSVIVTVLDSSRQSFITSEDVRDCIRMEYGNCVGMKANDIDLDRIEEILKTKNAVFTAEAYMTSDGRLNVKVEQRTPVMRFKGSGEDFFADSEAYIFHLQSGNVSGLTTVSGNIPVRVGSDFRGELQDSTDSRWVRNMIVLGDCIRKSELWSDVKISVSADGDLVLTPEGDEPTFIFGAAEDIQKKFARISRYYSAVVPEVGADYYSTVNVKFAGQIVCKK